MKNTRFISKIIPATAGLAFLAGAVGAVGFKYESPAVAAARAGEQEPAPGANATAWSDAGWAAYINRNDYDAAAAFFERALAADPKHPQALLGYGRILEIGGDYDAALRAYADFLLAAPEHPAALAILNRCYLLEEDTAQQDYYARMLEAMRSSPSTPPPLKAKASFYLFDYYRRQNDLRAEKVLSQLHPIRAYRIVGPFDNEGKTGFDAVFGPETTFNPTASYEGKVRAVTWRTLPAPLATGFIDLKEVFTPAERAAAYLAVAVESPQPREAVLVYGAAGAVKIWLNGVLIAARNEYHAGFFDQHRAPAPLRAGRNLLLVKVCGDDEGWGFGARFADSNGDPLTDLAFDARPATLAGAASTPGQPVNFSLETPGFFDRRIADGRADAFDFFFAALCHDAAQDTDAKADVPAKLMATVTAQLPGWADAHYFSGLFETEPAPRLTAFTAASDLAPGHLQALLELAKYHYDRDHWNEALDILDAVLARRPSFTEAAQYRAKIKWENGWPYDAVGEARALTQRLPSYPYSRMIEAFFEARYGDPAKAAALWEDVYRKDMGQTFARDEYVAAACRRGERKLAETVLKRSLEIEPYDGATRKLLVKTLDAGGEYDAAIAAAEEALRYNPEDYELWTLRGAALEKAGRREEARASYRAAIAFKHNYPELENYLAYLYPSPRQELPASLNASDLIAAYPGDDAFPRDSAVWLLNDKRVEVFENGTHTRTVHQVIRILTPEGAERFRRMVISYSPESERVEVLRAAVIKEDASEITATQIEDYNAFDVGSRLYYSYVNKVITMPNVTPGDTIDWEYKVSQTGANLFADYFGDFFTFGDRNATLLARYELTVPPQKRYYFRRARGAPPPVVSAARGKKVYTWRMENLPGVEEEDQMPPLAEILPAVQVSTFASWADLGRWYAGLIADVARLTPEVEALSAQLSAGTEDDAVKVARVYDLAVSQIRYVGLEFGIGGYRPHTPKQTLETQYGDCKDKATLINALLRAAGIQAYPTLVRTADLGELGDDLPILGLFNHMISYVALPDGRSFFLDGTASYSGYKELPPPDQGIPVLVIRDGTAEFMRTPTLTMEENATVTRSTLTLLSNGDAQLRRTVAYGARDAGIQRERYHVPSQRRRIIEEYWNGFYPGTKVFNERFSDLTDLSRPVTVEYEALIPSLYDPRAETATLDVTIHKSNLSDRYGKTPSRRWPLVIRTNEKLVNEVTYILPRGYTVASAPLSKEFNGPYGRFKITVRVAEGAVTVTQELEIQAQRVPPEAYGGFREFCLNVDDWESEPLIITKTSSH